MRSWLLKAPLPLACAGVLFGATTAQAVPDQKMEIPGAYGIARYYTEDGGKTKLMNGYVHDTAGDGHCAMLWMDFTTDPHEHHDAQAYIACGKGDDAWGVARHSTDSNIKGIRAAVCITGVHGCYNQEGERSDWPYTSWNAKTCAWYRVDTGANGQCGEGDPLG
ncbi:hypothetical protein [Streptomyces sp. PU-14G]|uniref:hypothetical protein n=1 Tax=Streptomyces sp. PU-14G TaxID=2800808 RepID=UPI0034DE9057